jgi:formiminoglutamase
MSRPIPHTVHARWPDRPAGRFASAVRTDAPDGCTIGILGIPDDTGIRLNNGRPGAGDGPAAFRRALSRYGAADPSGRPWPVVYDAGDISTAGLDAKALHETHRRVTEAAGAILDLGLFPIAIGGGHDLTFPFVRAVAQRKEKIAGIYFDAHLDVRPEVGSGMPFRALIEQCGVGPLAIFGMSRLVNSAEHLAYFKGKGCHVNRDDQLDDAFNSARTDLFVSFDLDVLDAACAPGVSAMNPVGWSPRQAETAAYAAGRCPRVRCFDIMELSPPHDHADRTARLAAHVFLTFLRGFAERPA